MSGGIANIPVWVQASYLAAAVCFILALKGLSSPRTARLGNVIGAVGMLLAVAVTFAHGTPRNGWLIVAAMAVGATAGVPAARAVKMTAVPQMVAAFNGLGGAAAALVSITNFVQGGRLGTSVLAATVFSVLVGCVTFTGSSVTFAKLQELMTTRPVTFRYGQFVSLGVVTACLALAVAVVPTGSGFLLLALVLAGLTFGVLLVLPIGGADVPVVISLLNAFSGLAALGTGYVIGNTVLIVAGTFVGAAGTLLTRLMAHAMGRPLAGILFGAFAAPAAAQELAEQRSVRSGTVDDVAILLTYAQKVLFTPGYGFAVAQAQHATRELADILGARGVQVLYGIHPVAGRMPGHMNVLLAEADVPYDRLEEMDAANREFASTDVTLVVGANDVVNPAARDQPGSPIYGMPILNVDQSRHVVFLKRSLRPGFAGIDNELLYNDNTILLFGDAKNSLDRLASRVKEL